MYTLRRWQRVVERGVSWLPASSTRAFSSHAACVSEVHHQQRRHAFSSWRLLAGAAVAATAAATASACLALDGDGDGDVVAATPQPAESPASTTQTAVVAPPCEHGAVLTLTLGYWANRKVACQAQCIATQPMRCSQAVCKQTVAAAVAAAVADKAAPSSANPGGPFVSLGFGHKVAHAVIQHTQHVLSL